MLLAIRHPNVIHADETFQYLEQAFRAVTGHGMVPWEYRVGIRSWALPGLLIPLVWAWQWLSLSPGSLFVALRLLGSAGSLACIVAAFALGRRVAAPAGGLWAGVLVALWPEIVIMSPHVLADSLCAIPLIGALAIGYRAAPTTRQLAWTGLLLASAALIRPQIAPTVAVAGVWIADSRWDRYRSLIGGALAAAILFGLIDMATLGLPFAWLPRYVASNSAGVASAFGEKRAIQYLLWEARAWWLATPLILLTAGLGARRLPLLAAIVATLLLTFSLVPHKEERFIYPMIPVLFTLCGVGTEACVRWLRQRDVRLALPGLAAFWLVGAAGACARPILVDRATRDEPMMRAYALLNEVPRLCGIGLSPVGEVWRTGLAYLRPGIDFHAYDPALPIGRAPYNAVLTIGPGAGIAPNVIPGATHRACFKGKYDVCVVATRAACLPGKPLGLVTDANVEAVLHRLGYE